MNSEEENYNQLLRQAWLNSSMERDKAIMAFSSAGTVLIVNFLLGLEGISSLLVVPTLVAMIAFAISSIAGIGCLHSNRKIIEREIRREEHGARVWDFLLVGGFCVGLISLSVIGIIKLILIV